MVEVEQDAAGQVRVLSAQPASGSAVPARALPYALRHHFANGGGPCYVVPVAAGAGGPTRDAYAAALERLREHDEPTLVVLVDAVALGPAEYGALAGQVLALCADMKDRFALLDVPDGDLAAFRDSTGTAALAYGAAYHPYLQTTFAHVVDEAQVEVRGLAAPGAAGGPGPPAAAARTRTRRRPGRGRPRWRACGRTAPRCTRR